MAYKDPRLPLFVASLETESNRDPVQVKIDRIFAELAVEMGLAEPDLMVQNSPEEWTLVYDKFSAARRQG